MADDEVRSIRFKPETWEILERLEDDMERSKAFIIARSIKHFDEQRRAAMKSNYPPAPSDVGVATYRMTFEFQLPSMGWSDNQADDVFFEFLQKLSALTPDNGGAYGQIDAIRPMEYDERFHEVRLPGQWKYHLDEAQMTAQQVREAREESGEGFLAEEVPKAAEQP